MSSGVTKTTLANGLTVLLKEMHHAPVTSHWVCYRVGSRNEKPGLTGASHWVEHMMFKGSPQFPAGTLDRTVSREGGRWNAFTSLDFTAYFETMPANRIDVALRLESDRMTNLILTEEDTESERTVIISERHMYENQPMFLLYEELQAAAFRVHSYHHEVIGDEVDLEVMSRDDLYNHYRRYYAPNNAIVVVVGDFESEAMLARIRELYEPLPSGPSLPPVRRQEPPQKGERRVTVRGPGDTAYLVFAYRAPAANHPDYFPLALLNAAFSGGGSLGMFGSGSTNKSSRLYRALVATDLAAGVSGSLSPTIDPFLFDVSAVVRAGRTLDEVETAMDAAIDDLADNPITAVNLEKALKQARAQFVFAAESVTGQARALGMSAAVTDDYGWYDNALKQLSQVTLADIERVRQTYLHRDNRTVGRYEPVDSAH